MWALNNGLTSGRFMFYGLLGTINGLAAPNLLTTDSYLATRTSAGWVTTLPGLTDHYGSPSGKECSNDMSRCLEYNTDTFGTAERESEAYLFNADGKLIERLPSISNIIPGANEYKGFQEDLGRLHQLRLLLHGHAGLQQSVSGGRLHSGRSDDRHRLGLRQRHPAPVRRTDLAAPRRRHDPAERAQHPADPVPGHLHRRQPHPDADRGRSAARSSLPPLHERQRCPLI